MGFYFITFKETSFARPCNGVIDVFPLEWLLHYNNRTILFYKEIDEEIYDEYKDSTWNNWTWANYDRNCDTPKPDEDG